MLTPVTAECRPPKCATTLLDAFTKETTDWAARRHIKRCHHPLTEPKHPPGRLIVRLPELRMRPCHLNSSLPPFAESNQRAEGIVRSVLYFVSCLLQMVNA